MKLHNCRAGKDFCAVHFLHWSQTTPERIFSLAKFFKHSTHRKSYLKETFPVSCFATFFLRCSGNFVLPRTGAAELWWGDTCWPRFEATRNFCGSRGFFHHPPFAPWYTAPGRGTTHRSSTRKEVEVQSGRWELVKITPSLPMEIFWEIQALVSIGRRTERNICKILLMYLIRVANFQQLAGKWGNGGTMTSSMPLHHFQGKLRSDEG